MIDLLDPTEPAKKTEPEPAKEPKDKPLKIVWLAVEPRHYAEAQRIKKEDGVEAYRAYAVSMVFSLDGQPIRQQPARKVAEAIAAAFEADYSGEKEK